MKEVEGTKLAARYLECKIEIKKQRRKRYRFALMVTIPVIAFLCVLYMKFGFGFLLPSFWEERDIDFVTSLIILGAVGLVLVGLLLKARKTLIERTGIENAKLMELGEVLDSAYRSGINERDLKKQAKKLRRSI